MTHSAGAPSPVDSRAHACILHGVVAAEVVRLSLHFVALDHSVLDVDDAVSIGGDVIFVGD